MPASSDPYHWVMEAVDTHEVPLLRYARRLLGDLDLARDAVQHAFVKLCEQSEDRLDGRVAPWLYRVCRNRALDHLRQSGRERSILDGEPEEATGFRAVSTPHDREADPAGTAERRDLAGLLRELLAQLPAPQREAIDLWCEGLTHKQIAEVTGRTEGHVRVLVHRGFSRLREDPAVQSLIDPDAPPPHTDPSLMRG